MSKSTARTVKSTASARAKAKAAAPATKSAVESILTNAFTAGYATADWAAAHKKDIGLVAGTAAGVLLIQELL